MEFALGIAITLAVAAVGIWYSYRLGRGARAESERERRVQFASEVMSLSQTTAGLTSNADEEVLRRVMHEDRRLRNLAKMRGWTDAGKLVEYAGFITNAELLDHPRRKDPRARVGLEKWVKMPEIASMWVDDPAAADEVLQTQGWAVSIESGVSGSVENLKQWHSAP